MGIKKLIFVLLVFVFLSGCMQSTALMGPTLTVATTGNINQAAFSYVSNKLIEKETGKNTVEYVTHMLQTTSKKKTIEQEFIALVERRFQITRQKLFLKKNLTN